MSEYTPETLAMSFHETYERLAPSFDWHTREASRVFNPNSPDGQLMIATVREVITPILERLEAAEREIARRDRIVELQLVIEDAPHSHASLSEWQDWRDRAKSAEKELAALQEGSR